MTHHRHLPRSMLLVAGAILVLAGCRALPVPVVLDLREQVGDAATGTVEQLVVAGLASDLRFDLPERGDTCLDVGDALGGIIVAQGVVTFELVAATSGPPLRGTLHVQPYLAGSEGELFTPAARAGERLRVVLGGAETSVRGDFRLTSEQLRALNAGRLCWSVRIEGDVVAEATGVVGIDYELREFRLRAGVALF
jgi:hypothetical protein